MVHLLKLVFRKDFCTSFILQCDHFDSMANHDFCYRTSASLCDVIVSQFTVRKWIDDICTAIANYCYRVAAPKRDPVSGELRRTNCHVAPKDGGPFTQVVLEGPDLIGAWNDCSVTKALEDSAAPCTWNPSEVSRYSVYHGTDTHLATLAARVSLTHVPRRGLKAESTQTSVTPSNIPLVFTTFSPFASFLSAAFGAEVIQKLPSVYRATAHDGTELWQSGDHTYEGVMLLQFESLQPRPPNCTSFIVPSDHESAWELTNTRHKLTRTDTAEDCWKLFGSIHQQSTHAKWPSVLHVKDTSETREALLPFTKQPWRSVWHEQGVRALNTRLTKSFAIKYVIGPADAPTCSKRGLLSHVRSNMRQLATAVSFSQKK